MKTEDLHINLPGSFKLPGSLFKNQIAPAATLQYAGSVLPMLEWLRVQFGNYNDTIDLVRAFPFCPFRVQR
jgi:hypothetical protein